MFLPYIELHKIDAVWDEYFPESLKAGTQSKRGNGVWRCVEPSKSVPQNWAELLRIYENKVELFSFLSTGVVAMNTEK